MKMRLLSSIFGRVSIVFKEMWETYIFGHWQSEIIQVTDNASLMDDFLSAVIYQW